MTRIVAVLTDPATVHICLDAAAVAAAAVPGGEVEAFHARLKPESMILPTEEVMTPTRRAHLVALLDKKTQEIRGAVREWVTAHQRENGPVWNEAEGDTVEAIVAARGKAADLVVLVRPAEHEGKEALHAAIFDTGRAAACAAVTGGGAFLRPSHGNCLEGKRSGGARSDGRCSVAETRGAGLAAHDRQGGRAAAIAR